VKKNPQAILEDFHAVTGAVLKVNRHYERENLVRLKRNSIEILKIYPAL
jgi:hypothetical protein